MIFVVFDFLPFYSLLTMKLSPKQERIYYCNLPNYQPIIKLFHFIHSTDVYPFMVGIFDLLSNVTICGGSILTIKYVLTSLHCVDDAREWKDLQVRIFQVDFHHKDRVPG